MVDIVTRAGKGSPLTNAEVDANFTNLAAVPAPNDGTLTMAVSGTGLSGSASFTADQAGASSFTVTSNATSANTGSAIVARDGSGNFSAGTITAALSGNATTATTATTLQTARTIGGVSFNGSANINLPGVNATGNQNTTGTAAVATEVSVTSDSVWAYNYLPFISGSSTGDYALKTDSGIRYNPSTNFLILDGYLDAASVTADSMSLGDNDTFSFGAGASGLAKLFANGATSTMQLELESAANSFIITDNGTTKFTFTKATGTIEATDFSGGGAALTSLTAANISAGTAGISISGNAATATTLQTARTINGVSFNGSANITVESYVEDDNATNATRYITFVDNTTASYKRLNEDSNLTYNPATNVLTAGTFSGALSGNATTSSSTTGNAATATTLQTARTIGGVSFNGSANIDLPGVNAAGNQSTTGNAGSATVLQTARAINGVSFNGSAAITVEDATKLPLAGGTATGTISAPTFNATSTTSGGFQGIDADSATAPSFTWTADLNTGMYRVGADSIGFTAGGTNRLTISTTAVTTIEPITAPTYYSSGTAYYMQPATGISNTTAGSRFNDLRFDSLWQGVPANSGPILTYTLTSGGSGYVDGTYNNKVLSGGGLYATFDFVVSGGIIATATLTERGSGFEVGDTISIAASTLGGTGSGGLITVNSVRTVDVSLYSTAGRLRLASSDISLAGGQEIGGIYFNARDASAGGAGDKAYILGVAEGSSGGGKIEFWTSSNGLGATKCMEIAGNNTFRLYNSAGTFYHAFDNAPTANRTLSLPDATGTVALTSSSITGNAATATTLQTARTIGGVSFNGSANINLPGVNTAGNQNTSGNAATATTLQTARTINGVSFNGSANITVADGTKLPTAGGTLTGTLSFSQPVGLGFANGQYIKDNGAGGLIINSGAAVNLNGTSVTVNGDTALHAGNYNSYSPTLTGGNASGTWGINVTGNAATATTLQTARTINGVSFNGSANITVEPYISNDDTGDTNCPIIFSANTTEGYKRLYEDSALYFNNTNNILYSTTFSGALSGNATTATTLQTARTIGGVSFNGSANINLPGVNAQGNQNTTGNAATCTNATNTNSISNATGSAFTWTGAQTFQSNLGVTSGILTQPPLQVYSTDNNAAFMSFHKGGHYAINMGLDSDNVLRIGGWSAAQNRWQLDGSGNMTAAGNVTAYSDERLKKDWEEVKPNFVDQLANVKSGTYTRTDSNERQAGVSAQSLQELLPETVAAGNDGMLSVAYGNAAMVAVVELAKEVRKLKEELRALKGE